MASADGPERQQIAEARRGSEGCGGQHLRNPVATHTRGLGGGVGENGLDKIGGCPNHFSPFVRQYPVHCDPTELPLDPENLNLRRKVPEENIMFLESGRDQGGGAGLQQRVKEKKIPRMQSIFLAFRWLSAAYTQCKGRA